MSADAQPKESLRNWYVFWGVALFLYYLVTMSRGLSLYDSGEIALAAEQLGLGHPLGQPLYTVLGFIATKILFFVPPLLVLNGFSAIAGAGCYAAALYCASLMLSDDERAAQADRWLAPTLAVTGALPALWEPNTRIEVYALSVFFALCGLAQALRLHKFENLRSPKQYLIFGLLFGLCASVNAYIALGSIIAAAPFVISTLSPSNAIRASSFAMLGLGAGLLPYLYIPLIALREDVVVWGQPDNWSALTHYVLGKDFGHNRGMTLPLWLDHLRIWAAWTRHHDVGWLLLIGASAGLLHARRMPLFLLVFAVLAGFFISIVAYNVVFAPDVLDYYGYLALPLWWSAIGLGLLIVRLHKIRTWLAMLSIFCLIVAVMRIEPAIMERTRHQDLFAEHSARAALLAAEKNSIMIVEHDHWSGALLYLQNARNLRPDVTVLIYGLTSSSWYWRLVYRQHRDLLPFHVYGANTNRERVLRFLRSNPQRPLYVEHSMLSDYLGIRTCPDAWFIKATGSDCPEFTNDLMSAAVANWSHRLREHSLGAEGALALTSMLRARDLWRAGLPAQKVLSALLAPDLIAALAASQEQLHAPPEINYFNVNFSEPVALWSTARNLWIGAAIAHAGENDQLAKWFRNMAYMRGLREARRSK